MANKTKLNIFMIYIQEAHTKDEWYIGESAGEIIEEQHKTMEGRQKCIEYFRSKNEVQFPIYPDDMNNSFMNTYASWPVRCFITKGKTIHLISEPEHGEVDFCELFKFALDLC
jgi:Iodothyronine deiodinase